MSPQRSELQTQTRIAPINKMSDAGVEASMTWRSGQATKERGSGRLSPRSDGFVADRKERTKGDCKEDRRCGRPCLANQVSALTGPVARPWGLARACNLTPCICPARFSLPLLSIRWAVLGFRLFVLRRCLPLPPASGSMMFRACLPCRAVGRGWVIVPLIGRLPLS